MVGSREHSADTVVTSGKSACNGSRQESIAVTGVVDTLEEDELSGVERLSRGQRVTHVLNSNVSVTDDLALAVEVLRSGVVCVVSICEGTSLEVVDLNLDVKVLVRLEVLVVLRVDQNTGNHVGLRGDVTHGDTVARALLLLQAVRQRLAATEVDEVGVVTGLISYCTLNSYTGYLTWRMQLLLQLRRGYHLTGNQSEQRSRPMSMKPH